MELLLWHHHVMLMYCKLVIAVGACACSGGIFGNTYATTGGIDNIVPVNIYIPGCPPRPQALLYGILMAINKIVI